jgi:hypothetical protein
MKTKSQLTPSEYGEIVWLLKSLWTPCAIAKKLAVSVETVQKVRDENCALKVV